MLVLWGNGTLGLDLLWILVVIGVAWLLSTLGILPENWWGIVLPLLLIVWGVGIWLGGRGTHSA